jgi:hypothetical protein
VIPFLMIPAGLGAYASFRSVAPNAARAALVLSILTAVAMFLGLARWPTMHWALAQSYGGASVDGKLAIEAVFKGLNLFLGNFIGEFIGETALSGFFLLTAYGLMQCGQRRLAIMGIVAGLVGTAAAFRNITSAVSMISEINNYVLPLWLIVLGASLLARRTAAPAAAAGASYR